MTKSYSITAFYTFTPLSQRQVRTVQKDLTSEGTSLHIRGLILVASEGINGTISGSSEAIERFKEILNEAVGPLTFKDSKAKNDPFKRFFVKQREEIVHIGDPDLHPDGPNNHISPTDWDAMIASEDVVILDTRNDYETEIGMFEGAVDPKLASFQEFPTWVENCEIPKDKKVLMYCTGGIRCEKASMEMQRQGYEHVYQLDGGILKYLEEHPEGLFKGECFVFDHRTAVDCNLEPSKRYSLCPHCGDPGDQHICCKQCDREAVICWRCEQVPQKNTCSKNCVYHLKRRVKASCSL